MEENGVDFFRGFLTAVGITLPVWLVMGAVIYWVVRHGR